MKRLFSILIPFLFLLSCEKENIDARIKGQPKCMLTDRETVLNSGLALESYYSENLQNRLIKYNYDCP